MKNIFAVALLIIFSINALGGVLKGRVTDTLGASLPYATVYIQGTTIGVNANTNGDYELNVGPGTYKVVCQYVGFKAGAFSVSFSGSETIVHNFTLRDEATEMKEVVVNASGEDPAYAVIRKTIERRKFHLDQLQSFSTGIYFKGVMRSRKLPGKFMGKEINAAGMGVDSAGKGVLYLVEQDADYYSNGEKEKTIIHSVHESGNKSGLGFSQFPSVISFYKNNIDVLGDGNRGYISPVSENALNYYRYKMLGTFMDHGRMINKIQVMQKRLYEPCFNGVIYIADDEWAIHSLDLSLVKQSGMDMIDTLRIEQVYLPLKDDLWVIKSQVMYFAVKFMMFDITGQGVAVYNRQKINEEVNDSVLAGKFVSIYDKTANKVDTSHWQNRPVPLANDEARDFVLKDSIAQKRADPAYRDSIRRKGNKFSPMGALVSETTFSGREYKSTVSINPLLMGLDGNNIINYNTVEGFNIAPKINFKRKLDTGKTLVADLAPRYGFSNERFNAIGRLYYVTRDRQWLNRTWLLGIEGGRYVFQFNPDNPVIPMLNTYRSLFARENDLKIYERSELSVIARRNYGNGFSWKLRASHQDRMPLVNTDSFSLARAESGGYTSNIPAIAIPSQTWQRHKATIITAGISFKPGYTYTQYPDYKVANGSSWPRFSAEYQKGFAGMFGSVSDFDKWNFSVTDDLKLKLLGSISYNVSVGGFLNSRYVSHADMKHLNGMRGVGYAAPYLNSFQFAPYYLFSNVAPLYGEAHFEYHLNGLLSNKIPLLRQARYYLLVGGNAFYSDDNHYYSEAFVGIDNIGWKLVRFLRVDFVQSWDSYSGRNSGIRVGINMRGVAVSRNNPLDSEW
jgi:hypothetical protein